MTADSTTVTFLGGLGEIGLNCMVLEARGEAIVVDCGILFPTADDWPARKYIPDLSFVDEMKSQVSAVVLTHGHEDHIGALEALINLVGDVPVFGSRFTTELVRQKFREIRRRVDHVVVDDFDTKTIGPFAVEFLPVCHNVPQGFALRIKSPGGVIFHTGDLKLDQSSLDGRDLDLEELRRRQLEEPTDLLLADSTNVMVPGRATAEASLAPEFERIFREHSGQRIIASTFASNIHRHQQFFDLATEMDRHVHVSGLSMERNIKLALELGLIRIKEGTTFGPRPENLTEDGLLLTTGSQAETMSGLRRMARGRHQTMSLEHDDVVLLSSSRIPGNGRQIGGMVDEILKLGISVFDISNAEVHATGHAQRDDLADVIEAIRPLNFIPIHGEHRHLLSHASLAEQTGAVKFQTLVCGDGDSVVLSGGRLSEPERFQAGRIPTDSRLRVIPDSVIEERRYIGLEGVVIVFLLLSGEVSVFQEGWGDSPAHMSVVNRVQKAVSEMLRQEDGDVAKKARRVAGSIVGDSKLGRPRILVLKDG